MEKSLGWTQPTIEREAWGEIYIKIGEETTKLRDVVLLPGKALPWDWKWSDDGGMDHSPGIREKDLDHYILSHKPLPEIVILSQGRMGELHVDPNLKGYLIKHGIVDVYILRTADAIAKYATLCTQGKRVAAMIHTTC